MKVLMRIASTLFLVAVMFVICACPPAQPPRLAANAVITCPGGSTDCQAPPSGHGPHCQANTATCSTAQICSFTLTTGSQCVPGDVAYCNPPGGINTGCDSNPPSVTNVNVCGTKQCVDSSGSAQACLWSTTCAPPQCTASCNGNAPVVCNSAGNPIQQPGCGASATCVNGACQQNPTPTPVPVVCTPGGSCNAVGVFGECVHGASTCPSGCAPGTPVAEFCDGKDNDCDNIVDNLKTTTNVPVNDEVVNRGGNIGGISDNTLHGPSNCGGTRVSATATKQDGTGWAQVEGWADQVCTNPKAKVGNSDYQDACKLFAQQGGVPGSNNQNDCRYIVHAGASAFQGVTYHASHVVNELEHCP